MMSRDGTIRTLCCNIYNRLGYVVCFNYKWVQNKFVLKYQRILFSLIQFCKLGKPLHCICTFYSAHKINNSNFSKLQPKQTLVLSKKSFLFLYI